MGRAPVSAPPRRAAPVTAPVTAPPPAAAAPMRRVLVTGSAGFIGFHLARRLLSDGLAVHGIDGMTDYYDVALKRSRHQILLQNEHFGATEVMLEDAEAIREAIEGFAPDAVVHLAAQAGVRYSLEAPRTYLDSNVTGTFNVIEACRAAAVRHLLFASTSSVYGANEDMPFAEVDRTDFPMSIYAATKKAGEAMTHSWSYLHGLPTTAFRFFTVYGPHGRPDLALYRFVDAILDGRPIDLYNHGNMRRDFTFIDDLVEGIVRLIDRPPPPPGARDGAVEGDSLSPVAPWRVVNIGNAEMVPLIEFVEAIEAELGRPAERNYMEMQPGDVPATHADARLLERLTGFAPGTDIRTGIRAFVAWFRDHHRR